MYQKDKFLEAYDAYADELFRFATAHVSESEIVSDLLQDTFTKTWLYISKGKEIQNIRAFLYMTLRNIIIDYYRKHKSFSLDDMLEENIQIRDPDMEDIEVNLDTVYDFKRVHALLGYLPPLYKEVIVLRYINDMSVEEIADILGETTNNVSVRIHRAIKKLQDILVRTDQKDA